MIKSISILYLCLSSHCLLSLRKLRFCDPLFYSIIEKYPQLLYLYSCVTVLSNRTTFFLSLYQKANFPFDLWISSLLIFSRTFCQLPLLSPTSLSDFVLLGYFHGCSLSFIYLATHTHILKKI